MRKVNYFAQFISTSGFCLFLFFILEITGMDAVHAKPDKPDKKKVAVWAGNVNDGSENLFKFIKDIKNDDNDKLYKPEYVSTSDLETAGFLDDYSTLVLTRADNETLAPSLENTIDNIRNYISGGRLVLFPGNWDRMLTDNAPDGQDANVEQLFENALAYTAANDRGFIGVFTGAAMAAESNSDGLTALGLIPGTSAGVLEHSTFSTVTINSGAPAELTLGVPIGGGSTFVPSNVSIDGVFLTNITGAAGGSLVASWNPGAELFVASATPVPEIPAGIVPLVLMALSGLAFRLKGFLRK